MHLDVRIFHARGGGFCSVSPCLAPIFFFFLKDSCDFYIVVTYLWHNSSSIWMLRYRHHRSSSFIFWTTLTCLFNPMPLIWYEVQFQTSESRIPTRSPHNLSICSLIYGICSINIRLDHHIHTSDHQYFYFRFCHPMHTKAFLLMEWNKVSSGNIWFKLGSTWKVMQLKPVFLYSSWTSWLSLENVDVYDTIHQFYCTKYFFFSSLSSHKMLRDRRIIQSNLKFEIMFIGLDVTLIFFSFIVFATQLNFRFLPAPTKGRKGQVQCLSSKFWSWQFERQIIYHPNLNLKDAFLFVLFLYVT